MTKNEKLISILEYLIHELQEREARPTGAPSEGDFIYLKNSALTGLGSRGALPCPAPADAVIGRGIGEEKERAFWEEQMKRRQDEEVQPPPAPKNTTYVIDATGVGVGGVIEQLKALFILRRSQDVGRIVIENVRSC